MENINQLKAIRDEALTRLQSNPDYRILTSLDQLIIDLEMTDKPRTGFSVVKKENPEAKHIDEMIGKMGAELASAAKTGTNEAVKTSG